MEASNECQPKMHPHSKFCFSMTFCCQGMVSLLGRGTPVHLPGVGVMSHVGIEGGIIREWFAQ